nr:hypothetical protein [Tanacetum cinerariifolium]
MEISKIEKTDAFGNKQYKPEDIQELFSKLFNDVQIIHEELAEYINTLSWNRPAFYNNDEDDDEEYTIAITPVLPTEEPDNSLSMRDEHLSTIPETKSDEVIKSSVEDLVPIPSDSVGISYDTCNVPFCDNSPPLDVLNNHFEIFSDFNNNCTLSDDNSFEDIDYVEASPPNSEPISLEEDNPTPSSGFMTKSPSTFPNSFLEETDTSDNSLPESEIFCFDLEEKRSGNPTFHSDLSLPDYEAFFCDCKPDSGDFTMDVVDDIFDNPTREPRVHVPNVLTTRSTLHLDLDFTLSSDSLGSNLVVSFPFGTRNKIFDPGIFIGVQSKRFLSLDEFSFSFIHDPPFSVIDTLLLFSSKNEDKVVNPGILATDEKKSHYLLSHQGFKSFQLFSESPMMIYGGDIPILDVPFLHFYPS